VELAFLAEETAVEAVIVFGAPDGPRAVNARYFELDGIADVPVNLHLRLDITHDFQQSCQERPAPVHLAARLEALVAQVPALAVDLPRHDVFRFGLHALEVRLVGRNRLGQELAKCRRVDLAEPMHQDGYFLPRAFAIGDLDAVAVAVDLDPWRVIKRWNGKPASQFFLLEGVAADAEHEPQQPFLACHGVEKPGPRR